MKAPITRSKCGTYAGANAHKRHEERLCEVCRRAVSEYMREWRRRTGRTTQTLKPIDGGPG